MPEQTQKGSDRQKELYASGMRGELPIVPADHEKLKKLAKDRSTPEAYDYIAGGAGREDTMRQNRLGFGQWSIMPRMLNDVSKANTKIRLFGQQLPSPILLAPIGALELMHKRADLAVAEAAKNTGVPMIFSNQASVSMESCARIMEGSPRWFQLYWSKSDELVESLVKRAEASGCAAIVVTLDTTMLGWRPRDLDHAYLPFLHGKGIAQYTSDPVFLRLVNEDEDKKTEKGSGITPTAIQSAFRLARRFPGGFMSNLSSGKPIKAVRKFIDIYSRPSLTWENLSFLRELTQLPILLKGILHPEDAAKALDYGVNGLIVSNHGGRQIDSAVSSMQALPGIIKTIDAKIPVILDSGVRSGADVFKAIALGAKAVCIGRPYAYGLGVAGRAGVQAVIENYMADFELTMRLSGCNSVREINRKHLRKAIQL